MHIWKRYFRNTFEIAENPNDCAVTQAIQIIFFCEASKPFSFTVGFLSYFLRDFVFLAMLLLCEVFVKFLLGSRFNMLNFETWNLLFGYSPIQLRKILSIFEQWMYPLEALFHTYLSPIGNLSWLVIWTRVVS